MTGKPSKKAVALFAAKTTLSVGSMAASVYVAKHPEIIQKVANIIKKRLVPLLKFIPNPLDEC